MWDYEKNESSIPFERDAMRQVCRDYVAESRDDLPTYRENMRYC